MFKIRDGTKDDLNFITNSWLKSARENVTEFSNFRIDGTLFWPSMKVIIDKALKRCLVRVAADSADQNHIIGYIVFDPYAEIRIIHWIYVKSTFRRFKVARALLTETLLDQQSFQVAYNTAAADKLFRSTEVKYFNNSLARVDLS